MAAKMLRCAAVGPLRVAVIQIGSQEVGHISSLFVDKSKYSNSWRRVSDGGMVIAENFWKLRGDVCFPSIANKQF